MKDNLLSNLFMVKSDKNDKARPVFIDMDRSLYIHTDNSIDGLIYLFSCFFPWRDNFICIRIGEISIGINLNNGVPLPLNYEGKT